MIDHIGIEVSDYNKAVQFYKLALAPLQYNLLIEEQGFAGFGIKSANAPIPDFWLHQGLHPSHKTHIAFQASNRNTVHDFYTIALKAGGKDNGSPGLRTHYHPNYYAAFILDLDGHNIEAVCYLPD